MSVLTRRAQVLFSPEEYELLRKLAISTKSSVGELVRRAVKKQYQIVGKLDESFCVFKALSLSGLITAALVFAF